MQGWWRMSGVFWRATQFGKCGMILPMTSRLVRWQSRLPYQRSEHRTFLASSPPGSKTCKRKEGCAGFKSWYTNSGWQFRLAACMYIIRSSASHGTTSQQTEDPHRKLNRRPPSARHGRSSISIPSVNASSPISITIFRLYHLKFYFHNSTLIFSHQNLYTMCCEECGDDRDNWCCGVGLMGSFLMTLAIVAADFIETVKEKMQ
jgi:hypothetical protein